MYLQRTVHEVYCRGLLRKAPHAEILNTKPQTLIDPFKGTLLRGSREYLQ